MRFNPKPLIDAIKASMKVPGYIEGDGPPKEWPRPPLVTDKMLGCVRLQDYTKGVGRTDLDHGELAELVESYLQVFVLYPEDYVEEAARSPAHWVRKRLNLSVETEKWLFPVKSGRAARTDVWRVLVHLMWWVSSVSGAELIFNETDLYCELGKERVGIRSRKTLSIYPELCLEVDSPDWRPYLLESPPGFAARCRSKALNRVLRETTYCENGSVLRQALLILFVRVKDKQNLIRLLNPRQQRETNPLQKLRSEVLECLHQTAPRVALRRLLVPDWMPVSAFNRLFKEHNPDQAALREWREILCAYFELDESRKPKRNTED